MEPRRDERIRQYRSLTPAPRDVPARRPRAAPTYCYLLDADADLADEFDLRMRVVARQVATAEVVELDVGHCDLWTLCDPHPQALGLLILEGVMTVDVRVDDRTATELVGAGDLLQPITGSADELLEHDATWHALLPTRLALLDAAFAERARPWPQIAHALLRRMRARASNVNIQRAIACQPRLDVRLCLLLWHFAGRWGRVEPGGIRLSLPLTHRLLGRLVGAERPSVSHALARLAEAELVTGPTAELHLHGTLEHHLACLSERNLGHHARAVPKGAAR